MRRALAASVAVVLLAGLCAPADAAGRRLARNVETTKVGKKQTESRLPFDGQAKGTLQMVVSIANQHVVYAKLVEVWAMVDQTTLNEVQVWLKQKAPWAWDPYMQVVFDLPAWGVLAIVAMILIVLGRKKRPLIGYARN